MSTPQEVRDHGWRQGCFLPVEALRELLEEQGKTGFQQGIIVSQDCDLLHGCFATEEWVEVLLLSAVTKTNGNFTQGKSSRCFHFAARDPQGAEACFECRPWNRVLMRRELLAQHPPSSELRLQSPELRTLIEWIAERYTRTAFPDGFVARTTQAQKKLAKTLKQTGNAVWRVLLQLMPERELAEGEEYEVNILCLVRPEHWSDPPMKANAQASLEKIRDALEEVDGLDVHGVDLQSTDETMISTLFSYRTWDVFNYLTHRDRLEGGQETETIIPPQSPSSSQHCLEEQQKAAANSNQNASSPSIPEGCCPKLGQWLIALGQRLSKGA